MFLSVALEIPTTQTAILQHAQGQAVIAHDVLVPTPQPGYVLVQTIAVALNPSDFKMGRAFPCPGAIVGTDFAGRVVAMHDDDSSQAMAVLTIGDIVCGISHGSNPGDPSAGAFAQYVLSQRELLMHMPHARPDLKVHGAAALGTALFTTCAALWGSLRLQATPEANLQPTGHREDDMPVLVYGGSTSCGTIAIQLLKLSGYAPIATCSPRNFNMVKSFGAWAVVDYSSPGSVDEVKQLSRGRLRHALDCITDQASVAFCYAALGRPGDRYASLEKSEPDWRTRAVVQHEFVMALEVLGKAVELGGDYSRSPNPQLHKLAQDFVGLYQRLLDKGGLRNHSVRVIGHGFETITKGLQELKSGSVSATKLVVIIDKTQVTTK
ncbi:chaperonin 10-like protein [Stachybotrys elegans]|uniref:Chaperonin 10-like protein n=1 Tax=Stachybotrys elegans TaxID=80388 RepID=A0A8K0SGP8_9HYPO|nr:chaperonin 10-like protein [Stachybotrys elegans]